MPTRRHDRTAEDAFLRMIVANPGDDMARLVYADWLDEQGEPRAEFIRIQIALATGKLQEAERAQLIVRATELYWKHHRYWNGDVYRQWIDTPLAGRRAHEGGLRGWYYRRGFPAVLDVNAEFFAQHAELILSAAPFQEIILRNPPQRLYEYFVENESHMKRFEKLVLPTVFLMPNIPTGLTGRIRVGVRARRTIAEFLADPLNARGRANAEHSIPEMPRAARRAAAEHFQIANAPVDVAEANASAAPRSVGQILRDVWRRIRGQ